MKRSDMCSGHAARETRYLVGHFGGFPLRLSWLPRLVDRYSVQGRVPSNLEEIACELGIGKNMAKALRAWARAAGFLQHDGCISNIAQRLFGAVDPYLEKGRSVALLHWLIASNSYCFNATTWVFNNIRSDAFTMESTVVAFRDHLASSGVTYASGTLRRDMEPVLRMHSTWADPRHDETDDRFFSQLRLLTTKRAERPTVYSRTWEHSRSLVSENLLLYALFQSLARRGTASSALSDLHVASSCQPAPGAVFGLTRDGFFTMVEHLNQDACASLSLSVMPGEDALLTANGDAAQACVRGDLDTINQLFFERASV